jgi:hypothetical protein
VIREKFLRVCLRSHLIEYLFRKRERRNIMCLDSIYSKFIPLTIPAPRPRVQYLQEHIPKWTKMLSCNVWVGGVQALDFSDWYENLAPGGTFDAQVALEGDGNSREEAKKKVHAEIADDGRTPIVLFRAENREISEKELLFYRLILITPGGTRYSSVWFPVVIAPTKEQAEREYTVNYLLPING